jgi:hypothetical protein
MDALIREGMFSENEKGIKVTEKGHLEIIRILSDIFSKEMLEREYQIAEGETYESVFTYFCEEMLEMQAPQTILVKYYAGIPI